MSLPSINFLHITVSEILDGQTFSRRPHTHPSGHENNTPIALKGCGVTKLVRPTSCAWQIPDVWDLYMVGLLQYRAVQSSSHPSTGHESTQEIPGAFHRLPDMTPVIQGKAQIAKLAQNIKSPVRHVYYRCKNTKICFKK